jgi:hypothetical protein
MPAFLVRQINSDIATGCGRNVCGSAASTSVTLPRIRPPPLNSQQIQGIQYVFGQTLSSPVMRSGANDDPNELAVIFGKMAGEEQAGIVHGDWDRLNGRSDALNCSDFEIDDNPH